MIHTDAMRTPYERLMSLHPSDQTACGANTILLLCDLVDEMRAIRAVVAPPRIEPQGIGGTDVLITDHMRRAGICAIADLPGLAFVQSEFIAKDLLVSEVYRAMKRAEQEEADGRASA